MRVTSSRSSIRRASSSTLRRITASAWRTSGRPEPRASSSRDHGDDGRERVAQFVREQSEELILGRVRRDQFLAQAHIARLVFDEEKNALHVLFRILQAEQIHVHEIGRAGAIDERLLDELERRAEGEDFLDRLGRRDLDLLVGRIASFLFRAAGCQSRRAICAKASFAWRNRRVSGSTRAMPLGMLARILSLKITSRSIRAAASLWRR